jgi:hypothetical protein
LPPQLQISSTSTVENPSFGCKYLCPSINNPSQACLLTAGRKRGCAELLRLVLCSHRDKLCIDQDNIDRALRCLPVFVFSCNRLMILAGNTYCDRLWCVWELYVFFSTSGARALKRVELHDFSDRGTSTLLDFEVANAHCFSPDDEAKLRSIIESGGASDFNDMIREGVNTACTSAPLFKRLNRMLCLRY